MRERNKADYMLIYSLLFVCLHWLITCFECDSIVNMLPYFFAGETNFVKLIPRTNWDKPVIDDYSFKFRFKGH